VRHDITRVYPADAFYEQVSLAVARQVQGQTSLITALAVTHHSLAGLTR